MWREQIPRIQFTARSFFLSFLRRKRNASSYHRGVSPTPMKKQLARPDPSCSLLCARTFGALKNEAFFKSIGLVKTLNSKMEIFKGLFINKKASGVYAYF